MAYETCPKPYGSQVAELEFELKGALEGEGCILRAGTWHTARGQWILSNRWWGRGQGLEARGWLLTQIPGACWHWPVKHLIFPTQQFRGLLGQRETWTQQFCVGSAYTPWVVSSLCGHSLTSVTSYPSDQR